MANTFSREAGPFNGAFSGRRVLVTGHTGFKGAWLASWMLELGAEVSGYSLEPPTKPSAFNLCGLAGRLDHHIGDIRRPEEVVAEIERTRPDFIFHMAAQALVLESYSSPAETFNTNLMGTVNLLEAVRAVGRPCVVVAVTSDKCYENTGTRAGYSEDDRLGGRDPYSASKACAEMAVSAYRRSYFPAEGYDEHSVALASVRAGNVIGGGDWGADRIVPDIVRSLLQARPVSVRNPRAVRPWQHVLDPLSGYAWLAACMAERGPSDLAEAWNLGPEPGGSVSVGELADRIISAWGEGAWQDVSDRDSPHEAERLRLRCGKAEKRLGWRAVMDLDSAIDATVAWYKHSLSDGDMFEFTLEQIREFTQRAQEAGVAWAGRVLAGRVPT